MPILAKELVGLQPDVICVGTTPGTAAVRSQTRTIPIVFAAVADPIGESFVESLSHPGGNITGFVSHEASMASKVLELLTQIAPGLKRVAIIFNPETSAGQGTYYRISIEAAARSFNLQLVPVAVRSDAEIEAIITSLGGEPGSELVAMGSTFVNIHRAAIISSTARNKVPTVYDFPYYVRDGGLLSYGTELGDAIRGAATYVDRILRGAKPADLPVQLPVRSRWL